MSRRHGERRPPDAAASTKSSKRGRRACGKAAPYRSSGVPSRRPEPGRLLLFLAQEPRLASTTRCCATRSRGRRWPMAVRRCIQFATAIVARRTLATESPSPRAQWHPRTFCPFQCNDPPIALDTEIAPLPEHRGGSPSTLYFTDGIDDETHGLLGAIESVPLSEATQQLVDAMASFGSPCASENSNSPHVDEASRQLPTISQHVLGLS